MTFGLRNAAQTFQRFIDEALKDLPFCYGYIDDILVFSRSESLHFQHLQQLFQRLSEYGIVVNTAKCEFGRSRITFLSHEVTADGIRPLADKVKALQDYPVPKTVTELRRFLGMYNFYRRFIPGAAQIQGPLNALLSGPKRKVLPLVLLGIRSAWKDDIKSSTAELVYGEPLRLPGEFFTPTPNVSHDPTSFTSRLRLHMARLTPEPASRHSTKTFYVPKDLATADAFVMYRPLMCCVHLFRHLIYFLKMRTNFSYLLISKY
ncbi:hypothetical protein ABMA27_008276 [Loxostege sticticalis]|uniref:Reverse transcriptase domain-containing protein n=1 Tax=Loxostege sticticalis TaxID=481309 RepID=A0ABR3HB51_LOXSC